MRDQFAMAVLPALVETVNSGYFDGSMEEANRRVAQMAYGLADAMLDEREKRKKDARTAA